jgi:LacI family repressor for deo operon, udp, cdd, tsx, nupC, and nupG
MITIEEVAKKAKVSPSTVSRVLNNGLVKKETKARVWKVIKELNYVPSVKARGLRSGLSYTVLCVLPHLNTAFSSLVLDGIESALKPNKYNVILLQRTQDPDETEDIDYANLLRERKVDGIILVAPREIESDDLKMLANDGFPAVIIEGYDPNMRLPCINPDNYKGGYLAVEHLIKQGHRRIAFIQGPSHWYSCRERLRGYLDALMNNHIPIDPELILEGDMYYYRSYKLTQALIKKKDRPTAIFGVNDYVAVGAMKAIKEAGLKIPDDIAVVGYDDIEMASFVDPSLTTIRQPIFRMGEEAAVRLLRIINEKIVDDSVTILPVELVVRESTVKA